MDVHILILILKVFGVRISRHEVFLEELQAVKLLYAN
jgi:hypothetical protein